MVSIDDDNVAFHRWVKEQTLDRPLTPDDVVHHVDEDRLNNDPDNLVILTRAEHARLHRTGKKGRNSTPDERERVVTLYDAGMTIQQVADAAGRPYSTVSRWLARVA